MQMLALIVVTLFGFPRAVADTVATPPNVTLAPISHHVGETLDYSLRGQMSQTILGKDPFGRNINQQAAPTDVRGHENIAITALSGASATLQRTGTVTAIVDGARPFTKQAQGWTVIDSQSRVVKDKGKLGGLFLLPLAFLGEHAMNSGNDLQIGDRWSAQLGTKLYGMLARPRLSFSVTGQRTVLGVSVYTLAANGTVPVKEPIMTASGIALGYATGATHINVQCDYDRNNRRLISLELDVSGILHYKGPAKHLGGSVHDRQHYLVALDETSMVTGNRGTLSVDPAAPLGGSSQTGP